MLHVNKSDKCCVEVNLKIKEQLLMPLFNRQCKEHSSVPLEVWKRNFLLSYFPIKTMLVICILCFFTHFIAKEMRTYPPSPRGKNLLKVSKSIFQFKIFCRFQTVYLTGLCYFISYLDFPQNDLDSYQRFFETYQHFVSLKEIDIIRMFSRLLVAIQFL